MPATGSDPPGSGTPTRDSTTTCALHGVETRLRCSTCNVGICPQCMVRTDVGLRCPDDARAVPAPRSTARKRLGWLGVVVGLAAIGGGIWALVSSPATAPEQALTSTPASPSATSTTSAATAGTTPQIWVSTASGADARPVTSRDGADHQNPAWSPDGSQLAFESVVGGRRSVWVVGLDGTGPRQVTEGPGDSLPSWSPGGGQIAFASDRDGDIDIYLINTDGTNLRRVTDTPDNDTAPAWSPDGTRIAFVSDRDGAPRLWTINPDGTGAGRADEVMVVAERPSWSPDGSSLAAGIALDQGSEVSLIDLSTGTVRLLVASDGLDGEAAISPDGTRVAFASNRSGAPGVWVASVDGGTEPTMLMATAPAYAPAWSPDGGLLAYVRDPG